MSSNIGERTGDDIAIISMACRFPKVNSIDELWEILQTNQETIRSFSDSELEAAGVDEQLIYNSHYIKRRGVIENIEYFDANFFGITPYEASITDPQQKIFLKICWEALEKAGYTKDNQEIITGVFAGAGDNTYFNEYLKKNSGFLKSHHAYQASILNSNHFLTTRVSYLLNLRGPSVSIAVGCSTSMVAIIQACQSLSMRNCDLALAGGVTIRVPQICGYMYQEGAIYSKDGKCRAFDAQASGTVPSNGAGVVLLKRLEDAVKDGDNIEAVIKSYAINNDGAVKAAYTAPSVFEQTRCIATALANINNVENIVHVEAHGTGTILGDPIEITALSKAFGFFTQKKNFCAIGSIKTNLGHMDVAAGVAGFIKSVLILKNKTLLASLNFNKPNPHISLSDSPFYVCTKHSLLDHIKTPLYASVSSLGIGGTNAHVILKEFPKLQTKPIAKPSYLILLSAKNPKAVVEQQNNLLTYLRKQKIEDESLDSIAYTLQSGRNKFEHRKAFICSDSEHLENLLQIQDDFRIITNKSDSTDNSKVVFLFQGQGTIYKGCVYELYLHLPLFKNYFDECCGYFTPAIKQLVLEYAVNIRDHHSNQDPLYQQIAIFVIEYSLAKTYITLGIQPDILLGHSLGEYTAICVAGILSLKDAINLVYLRAKLTKQLPPGAMLSIPIAADKIDKNILIKDKVSIAAINAPHSCVISGPTDTIKKLQAKLDNELSPSNQRCAMLKIPFAFHSKVVDKILDEYTQILHTITPHPATIPVITTVSGELLHHKKINLANHFKEHFEKPVLFSKCVEQLIKDDFCSFVEIGFGQTLSILVKQHKDDVLTIPSLPSERDFTKNRINQHAYFNRALGLCWANFANINWIEYYDNKKQPIVPLPTYPFETTYSWINPAQEPTKDTSPFIYKPSWELSPLFRTKTFNNKETWLIFSDDFGIASQLITKLQAHKQNVICVNKGEHFKQLDDNCYQINIRQKRDYEQLTKSLMRSKSSINQIIHLWSLVENDLDDAITKLSKQHLNSGFFSLIKFLQTWLKHNQTINFYLTVVTNHLKAIYGGDRIVPEQSTLLGISLVLPQETSALARIIDVDILKTSKSRKNKLIDAILNETAFHPTDNIIVYRNGLRFINRFKIYEHDLATEENVPYLRQQGVYVITGGLGKIGLELAKFLANNYKAHLLLIARNISAKKSVNDKILEIKKTASSLHILQADVTKYSQMKKVFDASKRNFSAVDGVIHLAAALNFSTRTLIKDIYDDQAYEQFKPKIEGTKVLVKLIDRISPRFCVAFSSLASVIGGSELCSYAASNCALDSMIEYCQNNTHTHWIGINWDAWMFDYDKTAIFPAQGFKLLQTCLHHANNARFVISINNLQVLIKNWVNYKKIQNKHSSSNQANDLRKNIDTQSILKELFADCLGIADIDITKDFYDLGGDSLSLLHLHEMITAKLPSQIKLIDLIRNRSVCELNNFLESKSAPDLSSCLAKIKTSGKKQPLFLIHPVGGTIFSYIELAKHLTIDHPLIAIQDPALESTQDFFTNIEDMAQHYFQAIQSLQNDGHYFVGGHSFGANVAFEIVKKLEQHGKTATLFVIDGWAKYSQLIQKRDKNLSTMRRIARETSAAIQGFVHSKEKFIDLLWKRMEALFRHKHKKIKSEIILVKANIVLPEYAELNEATNHWQNHATKSIIVYTVDGDHSSIMKGGKVKQIADILNKYLL